MAVENIPWMIQGGKHSAASGRRVLYKATGGAEGVAGIGDLRIRQQAIASGEVVASAGGATMVSRYPGVSGESYDGQNNSDTVVAIPANGGGSTRYDLVIARIDDWNFAGQQPVPATLPTDEVAAFKFAVITGVPAATKTAAELDLGYPAIALARIAMPAGTAAVTQAMITDLRVKVQPRRERVIKTAAITGGTTDSLDVNGEYWPNALAGTIDIPEWASRAKVVAQWFGVEVPSGSTRTGSLWVRIAAGDPDVVNTQTTGYDTGGVPNQTRQTLGMADDVAIPAGLRGRTVNLAPVGSLESGAGGYIGVDGWSSVALDIEFIEAATEDV